MNLYACEINVPKVLVGSIEVGGRFAYDSGIEHEVVQHSPSGTTVRRTARVAKAITDTKTGKTTRFSAPAASSLISSGSEVTPLGPPVQPTA